MSGRAVKLAEKLNSNFVLKYHQYLNLKCIISVGRGGGGGGGFFPEGTRGRIEQNITILMHASSKQYKNKTV